MDSSKENMEKPKRTNDGSEAAVDSLCLGERERSRDSQEILHRLSPTCYLISEPSSLETKSSSSNTSLVYSSSCAPQKTEPLTDKSGLEDISLGGEILLDQISKIGLAVPVPTRDQALDGGWKAWLVVVASVLIQTFAFAPTEFIFGVFVQEYLQSYPGSTPSSIALIGTIGSSTTYLFGFMVGSVSDRIGYRWTAGIGALTMALALVLASFSTQVWHLYLSHGVLFGIGSSLAYFSAIAAPTHWFKRRRGLAMGIAASGSGLGGFYLAPVTQIIIDEFGVRWTLRALGFYSFLACGIGSLMLFGRDECYSESGSEFEQHGRRRKCEASLINIPPFMKSLKFASLVGFQFCLSMAYLTPIYYVELYSTHIGISKQMGATINGWFNGVSFVSRVMSGIAADYITSEVVLVISIWTATLSTLFLWTFSNSFGVYLTYMIVYGFAFSGTTTSMLVTVAEDYGPMQVSNVLGAVYGCSCVALISGSWISGKLLEMNMSDTMFLPVVLYAGGMFTLAALLASIWVYLIRHKKMSTPINNHDEEDTMS